MRLTVILLLAVLWLFARVSGYTLHGRADALPVLALLVALSGRLRRRGSPRRAEADGDRLGAAGRT